MTLRADPSSHRVRTTPSGSPFGWAAVLRLLGALLCLGSVMVTVGMEFVTWQQTWLQLTAAAHAGQCAAWSRLSSPLAWVREGPHQDLYLAPAVVALLVMGVRVLVGKAPAIPPTLTALLLIIGALLTYFDRIGGHFEPAPFIPGVPCGSSQTGSLEPLFLVGLLAGLLGCIVLSRTTRYRPLGLHDA